MKVLLTADVVRRWQKKPPAAGADIYDTKQPRLVLRVRPSGTHSFLVRIGRGHWETLGRATGPGAITVDEARKGADAALGRVSRAALSLRSDEPDLTLAEAQRQARTTLREQRAASMTWQQFLDEKYEPFARANLKSADETMRRLRVTFGGFADTPLRAWNAFAVERWRSDRVRQGRKATTINRELEALKAALSKAVEWRLLKAHPLADVKKAKLDVTGRLRYLSPAEEQRLRAALDARDEARRDGRRRFNAWRTARGYKALPELVGYPDHMTPIVLLALNTGLRRGELLALAWSDVDVVKALLTVRGATAKTGLTRYVPLNAEAVNVLRAWKPADVEPDALVFPGPDGGPMFSLKTAWAKIATAAELKDFTFHDLRHTFASKLVQAGVDLNTVRELLGHTDIKMTLRYAHLAPEHRHAAVAKLVAGAR